MRNRVYCLLIVLPQIAAVCLVAACLVAGCGELPDEKDDLSFISFSIDGIENKWFFFPSASAEYSGEEYILSARVYETTGSFYNLDYLRFDSAFRAAGDEADSCYFSMQYNGLYYSDAGGAFGHSIHITDNGRLSGVLEGAFDNVKVWRHNADSTAKFLRNGKFRLAISGDYDHGAEFPDAGEHFISFTAGGAEGESRKWVYAPSAAYGYSYENRAYTLHIYAQETAAAGTSDWIVLYNKHGTVAAAGWNNRFYIFGIRLGGKTMINTLVPLNVLDDGRTSGVFRAAFRNVRAWNSGSYSSGDYVDISGGVIQVPVIQQSLP